MFDTDEISLHCRGNTSEPHHVKTDLRCSSLVGKGFYIYWLDQSMKIPENAQSILARSGMLYDPLPIYMGV